MDLNTAHAHYNDALARYTEALTRLEAGDTTPGLAEEVQRLYDQTLNAHAILTEAASAPPVIEPEPTSEPAPTPEAAPAQPEPVRSSFDLSEAAVAAAPVIAPAPVIAAAPGVAPAEAAPFAAEQPTVLGRRQGLSRFSPPPADAAAEQPLRRDVLSSLRTEARSEIGKERKVAGNLPEWNPLPPEEILTVVRR